MATYAQRQTAQCAALTMQFDRIRDLLNYAERLGPADGAMDHLIAVIPATQTAIDLLDDLLTAWPDGANDDDPIVEGGV